MISSGPDDDDDDADIVVPVTGVLVLRTCDPFSAETKKCPFGDN
jgi:hypothetical protein